MKELLNSSAVILAKQGLGFEVRNIRVAGLIPVSATLRHLTIWSNTKVFVLNGGIGGRWPKISTIAKSWSLTDTVGSQRASRGNVPRKTDPGSLVSH